MDSLEARFRGFEERDMGFGFVEKAKREPLAKDTDPETKDSKAIASLRDAAQRNKRELPDCGCPPGLCLSILNWTALGKRELKQIRHWQI